MKRPSEIIEPNGWLARGERLRAEADRYLAGLSGAEAIVEALAQDWASPALGGKDEVPCTTSLAPPELRAAFARAETDDPLGAAADVLRGRALARALLTLPPRWDLWERATDLRLGWALDGFLAEMRGLAVEDSAKKAWIATLVAGSPDPTAAVMCLGDGERQGVRAEAERWKSRPSALDRAIFRSYHPVREATSLALHVLRSLNAADWFTAVAGSALPVVVGEEISSVAGQPDLLLNLLGAAPPSLGDNGEELGTVVATLLAQAALEVPRRIEDALERRVRVAYKEPEVAEAQAALEAYRAGERNADLATVVDRILQRSDGRALGWTMLSELVEEASREPMPTRNQGSLKAAISELVTGLRSRFGESVESAHAWLVVRDAGGTNELPIIRWLTLVVWLLPSESAETVSREDATRMIEILRTELAQLPRDMYRFTDPFRIPPWVLPRAGVVLACVEQPWELVRSAFSTLETERMRERAHTDPFTPAIGSRFLLYVGLAALGQTRGPGPCARAEVEQLLLARVVFDAMRVIWLRSSIEIGGDISNIVLYAYSWIGMTLGSRSPFVLDALRYVVSDPVLALRIADAWMSNGWTAVEISAAFAAVDAPIEHLLHIASGAPESWVPAERVAGRLTEAVASRVSEGLY